MDLAASQTLLCWRILYYPELITKNDFINLTDEELYAYWDLWLEQARATNDEDKDSYFHGVFVLLKIYPE
jgi:hypothetical protein